MNKIFNIVQKYLFWWIMIAMFFGLGFVYFTGGYAFSVWICGLAALVMIYPSFVPLAFHKVLPSLKNYQIILVTIFINFIIFPAIAFFVGYLFLEQEPILRLGLILLALLPGGGMVTTWAIKSNADMPATIGIVVINLLIAIIVTPFGLSFFMNYFNLNQAINSYVQVEASSSCIIEKVVDNSFSCGLGGDGITAMKIAIPMFVIILLPLILAFITQKIIIKRKGAEYFNKIKNSFGSFSNIGLLIVLLALMSLENNKIIFENPSLILKIFIPLLVFYGIGLIIILIIYKFFKNKSIGKAFVWGSYLRYITLALGIAVSLVYQSSDLSVIISVVVMSYFIQIPSSFLLAKFLEKK